MCGGLWEARPSQIRFSYGRRLILPHVTAGRFLMSLLGSLSSMRKGRLLTMNSPLQSLKFFNDNPEQDMHVDRLRSHIRETLKARLPSVPIERGRLFGGLPIGKPATTPWKVSRAESYSQHLAMLCGKWMPIQVWYI